MEKLFININGLSSIMNLLVEKIQLLDSDYMTQQQKLLCSQEMLEAVEKLKLFFTNASDSVTHEKKFVDKIEKAFSEFDWNTNVGVNNLDFSKLSDNGRQLISTILKHLGPKYCGILIIETYLNLCLKTVFQMMEECDNKNSMVNQSNFKLLLEGFFETASKLKKFWHISFNASQKNAVMLCLHQVCKVLPFLLKMIESQNMDVKKYALSLLKTCLTKIQHEIHNQKNSGSNILGQEFISIMNNLLFKLNELSQYNKDFESYIEKAKATVGNVKPNIDEILCSAMSIAQVTIFDDDHNAILASSQNVLQNLEEFSCQIKEENICAIKLNANSLTESLCNLEQKVNVAVLKLVLEVFSNVNSPLKKMLNKCRSDISRKDKDSEDLNVLISEFDLEMDRIMQIGLFTMSCTTSCTRILNIHSCLASLESLETELLASLTALYVDCNSKNQKNFQCLFDFWLKEISELKILIDSVLDLTGFCEVVKNQIKSLGSSFKADPTSTISLRKLKDSLKQAVRYSKKLIRTLKTGMEDDTEMMSTTEEYFKKFQLAVQECEAFSDKLNELEYTNKTFNQAVKRYDFLIKTLDKLSSHLHSLVNNAEIKCNETEEKFNLLNNPEEKYYKLCEVVDNTINSRNFPVSEMLTPYINKGLLLSKKRNVFYATPEVEMKNKDFNQVSHQAKYCDQTPISSRLRYCKPLTVNLELENTIDFEFTTILDKISDLSNTFTKFALIGVESSSRTKENAKNCKDAGCGSDINTDNLKPSYTSSGCCANLDLENQEDLEKSVGFKIRSQFQQTLNELSNDESLYVGNDNDSITPIDISDRMNDLKMVEAKINFLRKQMPQELP